MTSTKGLLQADVHGAVDERPAMAERVSAAQAAVAALGGNVQAALARVADAERAVQVLQQHRMAPLPV